MSQYHAYPAMDTYQQAISLIPERRSSRHVNSVVPTSTTNTRRLSRQNTANVRRKQSKEVSSKGASTSPIRNHTLNDLREPPSRTFIPAKLPAELLVTPSIAHSRVCLAIRLSSPVFMGGATVEGQIHVKIDGGTYEKKRRSRQSLSLNGISVTLIGIERCKGRQEIFRALTTELIDEDNPPPDTMAPGAGIDESWDAVPSDNKLGFRLHLPVAMGPPPYKSKKIGISYLLSATIEFMVAGKQHFARQSQEVVVLTVHDRRSLAFISWKCRK